MNLKLATILDDESSDAYTIIPVNNLENGLEKEYFDHSMNSHCIFKRDLNENDYEIGLDYLEINGS